MSSTTKLPKISIIIPCYRLDRLKDITELLDTIKTQTYQSIEAIVVTEGPEALIDSIKAYIQEKGYSNILVLQNKGEQGSYASRNLGIQRSTSEIIAFIDDDALLFPNWAEETAKTYTADSSIIGLTGPILPLWEQDSMTWFPREFYWILSCTYWDWKQPTDVRNGYATNLSFRCEAFHCCGLFKTSLESKGLAKSDWQQPGAEETEFCLRVKQKTGKHIIYNPGAKVKHKVYSYRLSNKFIAKRAYWEGYTKVILNKLYRSRSSFVLSTEYELLRRILFKLLPRSLELLFCQPTVALRQLWVTLLVLVCVTFGYLNGALRNFSPRGEA